MPRNIPNVATSGFFDAFAGMQPPSMQVPVRDTTLSNNTGVGSGSGGPSLDVYGAGSPQAARNLTTNPVSQSESALARGTLGFLGGAIGGKYGSMAGSLGADALTGGLTAKNVGDMVAGMVPGYSMLNSVSKLASRFDASRPNDAGGEQMARPYVSTISDGLFGSDARNNPYTGQVESERGVFGDFGAKKPRRSMGEDAMTAAEAHVSNDPIGAFAVLAGGWPDTPESVDAAELMGYDPSANALSASPNVGYTAEANATPGDPMTNLMNLTNAYGTGGNGGSNQQSWGSSGDPEAAAAGDSAAYGYTGAPTGGYTGAPAGGYNTGLGSYGGSAWGGGSATTGGYSAGNGFADGGMVGLTGPMYSDQNQSPSSLAQMGFANGGAVGMGIPSGSMGPEQMQSQVAQMVRNPKFQQVVQGMVGAAMQSGELTPDELVMAGRIAEASMHNPSMYPKLRQFALQNGMAPLPDAFDPKVIMTIMAAAQLMGRTQPGQVPPTDVANMQNPTGAANGGFLKGPGTGRSDSIGTVEQDTGKPVKVANGEYVIPSHIVAAKGKDFFDKMLRQYAQLTPQE